MTQQLTPAATRSTTGLTPLTPYFIWGGVLAFVGGLLHGAAISRASYGPGYVDRPKAWLELGAGVLVFVGSLVILVAVIAAGVRLAGRGDDLSERRL